MQPYTRVHPAEHSPPSGTRLTLILVILVYIETMTTVIDGRSRWQRRKVTVVKRWLRTQIIPHERRHVGVRHRLASQHLTGQGLEIGALHQPLQAPKRASVRYVDRFAIHQLREHYPELASYDIVEPDIIDDGETLARVGDQTQDFVIANHMIEHCEDPIGTLSSHLRVLRPGGVVYMAVPDCRLTFDRDRPLTELEHLRRDHLDGPGWSRRGHYEEWAMFSDPVPAPEVPTRAAELEEQRYSIHFHVWTPTTFVELLTACRAEFGLPLEIEAIVRNDHEFIVILSRT